MCLEPRSVAGLAGAARPAGGEGEEGGGVAAGRAVGLRGGGERQQLRPGLQKLQPPTKSEDVEVQAPATSDVHKPESD